jgi:hypothetical protein
MVSLNFEIVTFPFRLLTFLLWLSFLCSIHTSTVPKLLSDEHTADHVEVFFVVNTSVVCQTLLIIKPIKGDWKWILFVCFCHALNKIHRHLGREKETLCTFSVKSRVTIARHGCLLVRNLTSDFIKHFTNSKRQKDC